MKLKEAEQQETRVNNKRQGDEVQEGFSKGALYNFSNLYKRQGDEVQGFSKGGTAGPQWRLLLPHCQLLLSLSTLFLLCCQYVPAHNVLIRTGTSLHKIESLSIDFCAQQIDQCTPNKLWKLQNGILSKVNNLITLRLVCLCKVDPQEH